MSTHISNPEKFHEASMYEADGQLALELEVRPTRSVFWLEAVETVRRTHLFGRKVVSTLVINPGAAMANIVRFDTDDISKLHDPQLRYALRLQDATEAAGSYQHSESHSSSHNVMVEASNEGLASRCLSANYTGTVVQDINTFMENLYRFAPDYDGEYDSL